MRIHYALALVATATGLARAQTPNPSLQSATTQTPTTQTTGAQSPGTQAPATQAPASQASPTQNSATQNPTTQEVDKKIQELDDKYKERIDDLEFQVNTLEKEIATSIAKAQAPQPRSASVFNPGITVFGNFLARVDDQRVYLDDNPAEPRVDNQFLLREAEVDFRAPIDPWADGVLILSVEQEVPNEFDTGIEEGYVTLKKLPFLDTAPGGLKLKIGRFRPEFGTYNVTHLHDLPQSDYPRSFQNFLGMEGLIQNGMSGQFFLPSPGKDQTVQATVQVLNGDDTPVAPDESSSVIAKLGRVQWYDELTSEQSLAVGTSGWTSDSDHRLYGVDATYKWKPFIAGEWRSFLLGGEFYAADIDETSLSKHPIGWFVWSQYQFTQNVYLGVRFDQAEELADDSQVTNTFGTYLTYYTTEFLRFRLGFEHAESDVPDQDGRNTGLLELNFVYGSHPVEPYWVNR